MKIETGKMYLDSNGNYVFIVGKTKEGMWLGQIGTCQYETFTEEGEGLLPNHKLLKEYKEPAVRTLSAYLWRSNINGKISITTTFIEDPNLELIASKLITLTEGEFAGIPNIRNYISTAEKDF
jgi:hypothetical protein